MDNLLISFNVLICSGLVVGLMFSVLSHRVNDGIVIKMGLGLMALGFAVSAYAMGNGIDCSDGRTLTRSISCVNGGLLIVVLGYLRRTGYGQKKRRRSTDWVDLDEADRRRVVGGLRE